MSTYWDLHCVTCGVDAGAFHWNHGDRALRDIIPKLPAIASLGDFADEVRFYGSEWNNYPALVEFATKHATHDVRPRNEYGVLDTQCDERWTCSGCGHVHKCERDIGHEGEHGKVPK